MYLKKIEHRVFLGDSVACELPLTGYRILLNCKSYCIFEEALMQKIRQLLIPVIIFMFAAANTLIFGLDFNCYFDRPGSAFQDFDDDWDWDDWDDNRTSFDGRYNRVEGPYLGFRTNPDVMRDKYRDRIIVLGKAGYAFSAKEVEYQFGLEKGFFDDFRFAIGGEYHDLIESPDTWVIPNDENSLAAMFLKEDFHDFYQKEGSSFYVRQNFTQNAFLSLAYHVDQLDSLNKNSNWAVFGGKKKFPENPAMSVGENKSIIANFVLDTRNSKRRTTHGWFVQMEYENALNKDWRGDFKYERALVDIRHFQSFFTGDGLDLRVLAASSSYNMPWHRRFYLGGLSTLRGFPYKAFPCGRMNPGGTRALLGQVEYRLGYPEIFDDMDLDIFETFNIILFADAGWVSNMEHNTLTEGFEDIDINDFKSDVGIAFANNAGNVRLEIARRTDRDEKPYTVLFRINRPF